MALLVNLRIFRHPACVGRSKTQVGFFFLEGIVLPHFHATPRPTSLQLIYRFHFALPNKLGPLFIFPSHPVCSFLMLQWFFYALSIEPLYHVPHFAYVQTPSSEQVVRVFPMASLPKLEPGCGGFLYLTIPPPHT